MAYNVQLKKSNGSLYEDVYVATQWSLISGKPSTFTPTSHEHSADDITSGELNSSVLPDTFQNLTDGSSNLPYRFDLIVYGDSDKYYPVHFARGNQDLLRTIKIWRAYSEQAPGDWYTSTHKGSLNLVWQGNYGNWGGAAYTQWIYENSSQYTTLLAGTQLVDNSYAMAFFLRGGGTTGAIYHFASDQPLNWSSTVLTYTVPTAFYNQEKTFTHTNSSYEKYAPAFKTFVDTNQLNSITVVKGGDPRLTNARTPTTHSHPKSQITNFDDEVLALSPAGARPANDVFGWAKAKTKPDYNFSDIKSTPTTIDGYGITDAYTKSQINTTLADYLSNSHPASNVTAGKIENWNTAYTQVSKSKSYKITILQKQWSGVNLEREVPVSGLKASDTVILDGNNEIFAEYGLDAVIGTGTLTFSVGVRPPSPITIKYSIIKTEAGTV